jgi:hypothetical protein
MMPRRIVASPDTPSVARGPSASVTGDDGAATTARTVENVLGEHPAQQVSDTVAP